MVMMMMMTTMTTKLNKFLSVYSALNKIITTGFKALQLEYFFTSGKDEVKAWTILVSKDCQLFYSGRPVVSLPLSLDIAEYTNPEGANGYAVLFATCFAMRWQQVARNKAPIYIDIIVRNLKCPRVFRLQCHLIQLSSQILIY
jgi:hypothetical protein